MGLGSSSPRYKSSSWQSVPVEDIDESEPDRQRSSWSMSSVTDVWNLLSMSVRLHGFHVVDVVYVNLSMSVRLHGFHVDDAVCVVVC